MAMSMQNASNSPSLQKRSLSPGSSFRPLILKGGIANNNAPLVVIKRKNNDSNSEMRNLLSNAC